LIEEKTISMKIIKRLTWIIIFLMRFEEWVTREIRQGIAQSCTKSGGNDKEFVQKSARKWQE
jgi:hypothetical protein